MARSVCTPYITSAGTSRSPRKSFSFRYVFDDERPGSCSGKPTCKRSLRRCVAASTSDSYSGGGGLGISSKIELGKQKMGNFVTARAESRRVGWGGSWPPPPQPPSPDGDTFVRAD